MRNIGQSKPASAGRKAHIVCPCPRHGLRRAYCHIFLTGGLCFGLLSNMHPPSHHSWLTVSATGTAFAAPSKKPHTVLWPCRGTGRQHLSASLPVPLYLVLFL